MSKVAEIFKSCVDAIKDGVLIEREGRSDKEFHFQNWFRDRLVSMELSFDSPGRNKFPDFNLANHAESYELKGLEFPRRDASYDSNSQLPCGEHNGHQVYYVFGRYPKVPKDNSRYPVLDLVLCHGSFINADSTYVHQNKSFRGFTSYGDILVRDRKMYVAPSPFSLAEGLEHNHTLIMPENHEVAGDLVVVDTYVRNEVDNIVVAYSFDLRTNEISTTSIPNPNADRKHVFNAYRLSGSPSK